MRTTICLLVSAYPAISQVQHGSVGVVHFTKDEISVAADSRGIQKGRPGHPDIENNSVCKVAAFGDDLVFVTAGSVGYPDQSGIEGWDNIKEARTAYQKIVAKYSGLKGHIEDVAGEWARSVTSHFNQLGRQKPEEFRAAVMKEGNLTVAYFGGKDRSGSLVLLSVNIIPEAPSFLSSKPEGGLITCPSDNFCAIGLTEIAVEFAEAKSDRAEKEKRDWRPNGESGPTNFEYAMFRTIRMVELTIKYWTGNEVGGPIDAVQFRLPGAKHVYWHDRKPHCPEN